MTRRPAAPCWSCAHPDAAPIRHPGQCRRCFNLATAAAAEQADAEETCLRCGRDSDGALCESCSNAPDVWTLLGAAGHA